MVRLGPLSGLRGQTGLAAWGREGGRSVEQDAGCWMVLSAVPWLPLCLPSVRLLVRLLSGD